LFPAFNRTAQRRQDSDYARAAYSAETQSSPTLQPYGASEFESNLDACR